MLRGRVRTLLHCLVGFALALQLGCETEASTPPVEKVAGASLSTERPLQTKKPTPPPADKIESRPKPAQPRPRSTPAERRRRATPPSDAAE
jgi:hypothetical protein